MGRLLLLALIAGAAFAEAPLTWQKANAPEKYVELRSGDKPVLRYNYGVLLPAGVPAEYARCCYVYPLWTPGGVSPLDDFPKDHYHHRGVFWAWPDIRIGGVAYDGWVQRGLKTENRSLRTELRGNGSEATLDVENEWVVEHKPVAAVREHYEIYPATGKSRRVLVSLTLVANDRPIELRGSHETEKSYGGLSVRFAPRENTTIRTEQGVSEKDQDLNSHEWAELEATYQGRKAAVRVDNAATNEGGSPQWCLRHYGFIGAAFPGKTKDRNSFTLEPGKPLTLRYTIVVADR